MTVYKINDDEKREFVIRSCWIANTVYTYSGYFKKHHGTKSNIITDFDGYPFEVNYDIVLKENHQDDVNFCAYYTDSPPRRLKDEDFTFIMMASRSTTTAYKAGIKGQDKPVKFYPQSVSLHMNGKKDDAWIEPFLSKLETSAKMLSKAVTSPAMWADAGLSMHIRCCNSVCRREATLSPEQVRAGGQKVSTMEEFYGKLRCRDCGGREVWKWPI